MTSKYKSRHESEKLYQKWSLELSIPQTSIRYHSKLIRHGIDIFEDYLRKIDPRIKVRRFLE